MARDSDDDMTVFDILERCGRILLGNEDMGLIFAWNGGSEFHVFNHGGKGVWYCVDFWSTSEPPTTLEGAMDRCRERLSLILCDEGVNESHDMQVDKLRAERASLTARLTLAHVEECGSLL